MAIRLKADAWDTICDTYGSAEIDPVEDLFKLRRSLHPHLNYVRKDGAVIEFGDSYLAALLYWFPVRRDLYRARLEREAIVVQLRIQLEEETLRYIELAHKLELSKVDNVFVVEAVLASQAPPFVKFDNGLLHSPGYTSTEDLRPLILEGPGTNYDYVLNLRERDLLRSAAEKRRKGGKAARVRLREILGYLDDVPFAGARLWVEELEAVQTAVVRGIVSRWRF